MSGGNSWVTTRELEPERQLWWAVLGQAMRDSQCTTDADLADEARRFFEPKRPGEPDGFGAICSILGLDREWAAKLALEGCLPPKTHLKPHARKVAAPYKKWTHRATSATSACPTTSST